MQTFHLRGLAEGLVGCSEIQAQSAEEIFEQNPLLAENRSKLSVNGTTISGYAPCDG